MSIDIATASTSELVKEAEHLIALIKDVYPDKSNRDQVLDELLTIVIALSKK